MHIFHTLMFSGLVSAYSSRKCRLHKSRYPSDRRFPGSLRGGAPHNSRRLGGSSPPRGAWGGRHPQNMTISSYRKKYRYRKILKLVGDGPNRPEPSLLMQYLSRYMGNVGNVWLHCLWLHRLGFGECRSWWTRRRRSSPWSPSWPSCNLI